jgi:hypothetical protein
MRSGVNIASVVLPALLLATEVSSVLAQTASAPSSKPIVLLRIVEQSKAKTTAKPVAQHKFASQSRIRRYARLARRHHPVQAHASEEVRPAADAPVVPPAPLQPPAPPAAEQLGKFVVGGNALQVVSSVEVNALDLPANNSLLQSNGAPPNIHRCARSPTLPNQTSPTLRSHRSGAPTSAARPVSCKCSPHSPARLPLAPLLGF